MPNPLQVTLMDVERTELEDVRGHHCKAYVRERAAAILKIAEEHSGRDVARNDC